MNQREQGSKRRVDLKINLCVNVLCSEQELKSKQGLISPPPPEAGHGHFRSETG